MDLTNNVGKAVLLRNGKNGIIVKKDSKVYIRTENDGFLPPLFSGIDISDSNFEITKIIDLQTLKLVWAECRENWKTIKTSELLNLKKQTKVKICGKEFTYCIMSQGCGDCINLDGCNELTLKDLFLIDEVEILTEW